MCKTLENFIEITKSNYGKVNLANESSTDIHGKGTVSLAAATDEGFKSVSMYDTLHVPNLRTNLLSVSKIADKNYKIVFEKEKATIVNRNGDTVLLADRIGKLYYIHKSKQQRKRGIDKSPKMYIGRNLASQNGSLEYKESHRVQSQRISTRNKYY